MKTVKSLSVAVLSLLAVSMASAQNWPVTSKEGKDNLAAHMEKLKKMPENAPQRSATAFVEKVDFDELNFFLLNGKIDYINIVSLVPMSNKDVTERPKGKTFVSFDILNDKGEVVYSGETDDTYRCDLTTADLKLPDGVYRVRVNYGKKYAKLGTKPEDRSEIRLTPVFKDASEE